MNCYRDGDASRGCVASAFLLTMLIIRIQPNVSVKKRNFDFFFVKDFCTNGTKVGGDVLCKYAEGEKASRMLDETVIKSVKNTHHLNWISHRYHVEINMSSDYTVWVLSVCACEFFFDGMLFCSSPRRIELNYYNCQCNRAHIHHNRKHRYLADFFFFCMPSFAMQIVWMLRYIYTFFASIKVWVIIVWLTVSRFVPLMIW